MKRRFTGSAAYSRSRELPEFLRSRGRFPGLRQGSDRLRSCCAGRGPPGLSPGTGSCFKESACVASVVLKFPFLLPLCALGVSWLASCLSSFFLVKLRCFIQLFKSPPEHQSVVEKFVSIFIKKTFNSLSCSKNIFI